MKKVFALLLSALMILTLAACSNTNKSNETAGGNESENETVTESTAASEAPASVDISSWNWVDGELDCYGYTYQGEAYYLSYKYPEIFKTETEAYSGLQHFGYYYNPSDDTATANGSPYGIYIYFGQGSDGGATKDSLAQDVQGGLVERDLGGRTVLFGELSQDPNTGSHTFAYYLSYEDDGWSRIWMIVSDPEADGVFRKTFEESMSFDK